MEKRTSKLKYSYKGLRTGVLTAVAIGALGIGSVTYVTSAQSPTPTPATSTPGTSSTPGAGAVDSSEFEDMSEDARTAHLAASFQEHVYLSGVAVEAILQDSPEDLRAAEEAMQESTGRLAALIEATFDDADGSEFMPLWMRHADLYQQYAMAVSGSGGGTASPGRTATATSTPSSAATATSTPRTSGSPSAGSPGGSAGDADQMRSDLEAWAGEISAFFADADSDIDEDRLELEFKDHVDAVLSYIDARADESPDAFSMATEEGHHMVRLGIWLATGDDEALAAAGPGGDSGATATATATSSTGSDSDDSESDDE